MSSNRRRFLRDSLLAAAGAALTTNADESNVHAADAGAVTGAFAGNTPGGKPRKFELGTVTYNLARAMDIETLIKTCEATGFKAVELRSTHKHGVEPTIDAAQRKVVRERFAKSKVKLFGVGSACEYHSDKADVVKKNIALSKQFIDLAADVGATGVKVRPNGFVKGVKESDTLKQIGEALQEVGTHANQRDVEVWVEVHGRGTAHPPHMKTIMQHCGHPSVGVTWNCNPQDIKDGSVREYFKLLAPHIKCVHLRDMVDRYPHREMLLLLRGMGYDRYTLAEVPETKDPIRVMKYYRAMWELLSA